MKVGTPERRAARLALDEHLAYDRLDDDEYRERCAACELARTESELMQLFADLPQPHPELWPPADADEDVTALGWAVGIALGFGLLVAVVLGVVYGAWWSLAVPVAVSVGLLFTDHLVSRNQERRQTT